MPVVVCGHHKCIESCFTVLLPILGYFEEEPPVLFKPLVIPSISLRGSLFVVHVLPGIGVIASLANAQRKTAKIEKTG